MANMTFYHPNFINTTTMIQVSTGTANAAALIDRDEDVRYTSVGDNSDLTTTTIRIEFSSAQNLSCIALQNINLKSFKVYYNSNTANTITLTNGDTTTSVWSTNSATSIMMCFSTISASIITIDATTTMVANAEKAVGELWCLGKYHTFERNPGANEYLIKELRKQYVHEMSDGGTAVYFIQDNISIDITRTFVDPTEYATLKSMRRLYTPVVFAPEPTGTAWNSQIWEVNWIGDFEFLRYTQNYKQLGYSGKMNLRETPK